MFIVSYPGTQKLRVWKPFYEFSSFIMSSDSYCIDMLLALILFIAQLNLYIFRNTLVRIETCKI